MEGHFNKIAMSYNGIRTTDAAPVEYIRAHLAGLESPRCADIGCGAGRYAKLLLGALPRLTLYGVDESPDMIREARNHVGIADRFVGVRMDAEAFLSIVRPPLDAIFCMNSVHHIGFRSLLDMARPAIKPGGQMFIYTRTRTQNAGSVWGRHFPSFAEREIRLPEEVELRDDLAQEAGWRAVGFLAFTFARKASVDRLVQLARENHYSTFCLYKRRELTRAIEEFERNIRRAYPGPGRVSWEDGNLMVHLEREG